MSYKSRPFASKLFQLTALTLALTLAACGGDGVDSIAPKPDLGVLPGEGDNDSATNASGIYISSEKTRLLTGEDKSIIYIRVTDNNGGIIEGAPVDINIADAALYGLSLSGPSKQLTDEQGMVTIELIQSNEGIDSQLDHESLLTVSVNKRNGVVEQTFPILVSGTYVNDAISTQNAVSAGENFRVSGQLLDGSGKSINNVEVTLYNNDKNAGTGRTDAEGRFVFDVNASNLESSNNNYLFSIDVKGTKTTQRIPDILNVASENNSSLSFSQTPDIIVGNTQKITLSAPDAKNGDTVYISTNKGQILATSSDTQGSSRRGLKVVNGKVEFYLDSKVPGKATIRAEYGTDYRETVVSIVSITPTKLLLKPDLTVVSVGGSTEVTARVLDKDDAAVKNAIVQFTTLKDASGGSLSQSVAYTDDKGIATVTYSAGSNPTSINGVNIKAEVRSVKLPNGQEKAVNPIQATTDITVQTKSSYISFAFADKVSSDDSNVYYFRKGSVTVLKSAGNPVSNQRISISVTPDSYLKGFFEILEAVEADDTTGTPATEKQWGRKDVTCQNEDKNNNGILDPGEDFNGNGRLDPINVAAILTEDGQIVNPGKSYDFTTDSTGRIDFSIRYAKQYANWYMAKVTVTTKVDGSESQQARVIDFPMAIDDADLELGIRPNLNSPFGTRLNCSNPN